MKRIETRKPNREEMEPLREAFDYRAIKPVIHKTLRITQAEAAHAILQRRENLGKVVLTIKGRAS